MRLRVRSLALLSGLTIQHCSDLVLLWLWRRLKATAPIQPLAWEPPYAAGAAQEIATTTTTKKTKDKKQNKTKQKHQFLPHRGYAEILAESSE